MAVNDDVDGILCETVTRVEEPALLDAVDRVRSAEAEATRAVDEVAGTMRGAVALSAGIELVRDRRAAMMMVRIVYRYTQEVVKEKNKCSVQNEGGSSRVFEGWER